MFPPAPDLFSTTTACPHASWSFCARRRETTSVVPPAGNGHTIFTGFCGHACAIAAPGTSATTAAARMRRHPSFIIDLSSVVIVGIESCSAREREGEPRGQREPRRHRGEGLLPIAPWE